MDMDTVITHARRIPARGYVILALLLVIWIYPHARPIWPLLAAVVGALWGFTLSPDTTYKGYAFSILTGVIGFVTLGLAGGIMMPDFILIFALGGGAAFLNVPNRLASNEPDIADRIIERFFLGLYRFSIGIGSGLVFGCLSLLLRFAPEGYGFLPEAPTPVINSSPFFAGMIAFMTGSVLLFDEYYRRRKLLAQ
ncbi:MAG: hypothetical protein ABFD69_11010 [Candidatus Sumerlaeia bacterium]